MRSLGDLIRIRDEIRRKKEGHEREGKIRIIVGMGSCGIAAGARKTMKKFVEDAGNRHLDVEVTQAGCIGLCELEPIVEVILPGQPSVIYGQVLEERAKAIVYRHLVNGSIIDDWVIGQRQIEWDRDKPGGNFGREIIPPSTNTLHNRRTIW
jgi:NADP-reducing hydrogenase subunit HndB